LQLKTTGRRRRAINSKRFIIIPFMCGFIEEWFIPI
jgi:hypothetical protein